MKTERIHLCKPIVEPICSDASLFALSEVISRQSNPAVLGGNDSVQGHSIFTAEPVDVFEVFLDEKNPFEKLSAFLSRHELAPDASTTIFPGGWIGFFGYELSRYIEKLPTTTIDDIGFPVIRLAFYDKAIVFDHRTGQFYFTMLDCDGLSESTNQKRGTLQSWLTQAQSTPSPNLQPGDMECVTAADLLCNMTREQYMAAIEKIKRYIYDGDTYQINFSQRFAADFVSPPVDLFHWQNLHNPCPYSAYVQWHDKAIVSASPELFFRVQGDMIQTCPIKGTRPRNASLPDDAAQNQACIQDLLNSAKDRAELAMIVDLERNDLARLCIPGTRGVTHFRELMTLPSVYHTVATVEGNLKSPPGPQRIVDILKAAFPGGSITGAPKIRSMEIIDELEPTARGVYTGAIGWIDLNFDLCWNIAIRTIVLSGQKAYIQAGGGIVADSDPTAEWNETLTKAKALFSGISAAGQKA